MADLPQSNAQVIADLARAGQGVVFAEQTPFVVTAPGHEIKSVERYGDSPARVRGTTTAADLDSFIRYAVSHSDDISGELYWTASESAASFQCVFNAPRWRDYRLIYTPAPSVEWKRWTGMNGKHNNQTDFAVFIEDNAPDIVTPSSADMIDISRSLEAKKKVNFASGIRLSNGENELTFEEQIEGSAGKGKLKIPEDFWIGIEVLEGAGIKNRIKARLRYRIDGSKLSLWYDLERPHKDLEDAVKSVWWQIESETGAKIFRGAP